MKMSRRVLDPHDRIAEVLFGLIMVITFTGSLNVADAGREEVRAMLVGALGCNVAWGIIDAALYLMGCLAEKERGFTTTVPAPIASVLNPAELDDLRRRLQTLPEPARAQLTAADWAGALGVMLLVFLSTFPVVIPFIVMRDVAPALRVSNAIAIAMLFLLGWTFGRITRRHPVRVGIGMVLLGIALVGVTMALGG